MDDNGDWELIRQAQAGDEKAYADLVRRHQQSVVYFCYRMLSSFQDAEEIAQETFVRLYRQLHRLEPRAQVSTLLFGIARNLALNHIRDMRRLRRDAGQACAAELSARCTPTQTKPDETAQLHELEAIIERGIASLPDEFREVLLLREIQCMDYNEIAKVMRCANGTVKSRLARAREQLRAYVVQAGGELR